MSDDSKTRTITLTDRPPVKIREDDWPRIAKGAYSRHDSEYESQANRQWRVNLCVRQHADGRAIVYGVYDYTTRWQWERGFAARAGVLLEPDADLVAAIRGVGETITEASGSYDYVSEAVRECIADLPAEEL